MSRRSHHGRAHHGWYGVRNDVARPATEHARQTGITPADAPRPSLAEASVDASMRSVAGPVPTGAGRVEASLDARATIDAATVRPSAESDVERDRASVATHPLNDVPTDEGTASSDRRTETVSDRPPLNGRPERVETPSGGPPVADSSRAYERESAGTTAPQLRRFIKSRAYVPMHELRRRFGINGNEDDVTPVELDGSTVYVGLPLHEGRLIGDLFRGGEVGYELSLDPGSPIVIGVYPMRPVPRH